MKKLIISTLAAAALLFGFASCSGDLHDVSLIDLSNYAVIGSLNDFSNTANPLTKNADGTYSATWTAVCGGQTSKAGENAGETFAIIEQGDGTWGTAYRLAQPKAEGDAANVFSSDNSEQKVYQGQSADCMLIPNDMVSKGDTVKLTITPDATFISVKVSVEKSDSPVIEPYYLDGMYLVGGVFNVDGTSANTWSFSSENLIWGATTNSQTKVVSYTKDVTATAAEGEMGINDSTWGNKQLGSGVTIAADAADATVLDGEKEGNFKVTGLTVGDPYRVEITTTPEKVVSVKIYKIAKVTLSFKITGLTEGDSAWVNGSVWGSGWPQGWPIVAWNSGNAEDTAKYIAAHPAAVADSDGVATFDPSWNTTFIAKLGDTMDWACKVVYIEDGSAWDDDGAVKGSGGTDLQFKYEVTAGGAYTFVIDAANGWEISVE